MVNNCRKIHFAVFFWYIFMGEKMVTHRLISSPHPLDPGSSAICWPRSLHYAFLIVNSPGCVGQVHLNTHVQQDLASHLHCYYFFFCRSVFCFLAIFQCLYLSFDILYGAFHTRLLIEMVQEPLPKCPVSNYPPRYLYQEKLHLSTMMDSVLNPRG